MGSAVSSAANGLGTLVGNAVAAPFRAFFGASCEGVCSGTLDLPCFIEHLCFSSLARLLAILVVTYFVLLLGYLLCKLGIVKCVAKNAFKTVWIPCSACCRALCGACCLLWRNVRDTERVYRGPRGRRRDVELGDLNITSTYDTSGSSSSSSDDDGDDCRGGVTAGSIRSRAKSSSSVREKRKDRIRQSLRLKRVSSQVERAAKMSQGSGRRRHRATGPRRTEVPPPMSSSLRVHGSPARGHPHARRRN